MFCSPINIVWIERGIILILVEYISSNLLYLKNKTIVLENNKYRNFLQSVFSKLKFTEKSNSKNSVYFNVRKIIKKQNLVIDYLNNYNNTIPGTNVLLVPYFDYNDPLILYIYNSKTSTPVKNVFNQLQQTYCYRANFRGTNWDLFRERQVLNTFSKINKNIHWKKLFYLINTYFKKYQQERIVNKYHFIPVPIKDKSKKKIIINDDTNPKVFNEFIQLINNQLDSMNELMEQ